MRKRVAIFLIIFLFAAIESVHSFSPVPAPSSQKLDISHLISKSEFQALAEELSHRVNLFRAVWKQDSEALFYGGTSRDFLYWLKGKLSSANSRSELDRIIRDLKKERIIDVRDFIIGDSDIDIVSDNTIRVTPENFGIKKVDIINSKRFDPNDKLGQNEINQGYLPAEKIRLGREGFITDQNFGDGIREVLTGRITVHFTNDDVFAETWYAQKKQNHPILLAIRFLRLIAINYFYAFGKDYPDLNILFDIDPESEKQVKRVIQHCLENVSELEPYLKETLFVRWINAIIKKAFRSYTNPTATNELFKRFQLHELISMYEAIEPVNQYLFAKHRNMEKIAENFRKHGIDPSTFFEPVSDHFSNGLLYHGTGTEDAFRAILFQGVLPSATGLAGDGLYGVSVDNIDFAIEWGNSRERVISFRISPKARIVDISKEGPARELFKSLGSNESLFADTFGIDIIRYPYNTRAYVVKNSAVLSAGNGVFRKVMSLSRALAIANKIHSEEAVLEFIKSLEVNRFSKHEMKHLIQNLPDHVDFNRLFLDAMESKTYDVARILSFKLVISQEFLSSLKDTISALNADQSQFTNRNIYLNFLADIFLPLPQLAAHSQGMDFLNFCIDTALYFPDDQRMQLSPQESEFAVKLVSNVLSQTHWANHEQAATLLNKLAHFRKTMVEKDTYSLHYQLVTSVLSKPEWAVHDEAAHVLMVIMRSWKNNDTYRKNIANAISEHVLSHKFWAEHKRAFSLLFRFSKTISRQKHDNLAQHILSKPYWMAVDANGEILASIIRKSLTSTDAAGIIIKHILSQPYWATHKRGSEFVELLLKSPVIHSSRVNGGSIQFIIEHILSEPHWASHKKADSFLNYILNTDFGEYKSQACYQILEKVLSKPFWASHERSYEMFTNTVTRLLAAYHGKNKNDPDVSYDFRVVSSIFTKVLAEPHWVNHEKSIDIIRFILKETGKYKLNTKTDFIQKLIELTISGKYWARHGQNETVLNMLLSLNRDSDIAKSILTKPHWIEQHVAVRILKKIIKRGLTRDEVIRHVLSRENWAHHDSGFSILSDLVDRGLHDKEIAEHVLSQPHWAEREGSTELVETLIARGTNAIPVALYILNQPCWIHHPKGAALMWKLLEGKNSLGLIAENTLAKTEWHQRPEGPQFVKYLIENGDITSDWELAEHVFRDERWANHPEGADLLMLLIQKHTVGDAIATYVLSQKHWAGHDRGLELLETLYKTDPDSRFAIENSNLNSSIWFLNDTLKSHFEGKVTYEKFAEFLNAGHSFIPGHANKDSSRAIENTVDTVLSGCE